MMAARFGMSGGGGGLRAPGRNTGKICGIIVYNLTVNFRRVYLFSLKFLLPSRCDCTILVGCSWDVSPVTPDLRRFLPTLAASVLWRGFFLPEAIHIKAL